MEICRLRLLERGEKMFIKTVIRQGEKIHNLETDLNLEKSANEDLRNENLELKLEINRLEKFKNKVIDIVKNEKAILDRDDKIKELVDKLATNNKL